MYGKPANSEAYERYIMCKTFGWDYYTYMNQPKFFVEELKIILIQEAQKAESDNKAASRKLK